MARNDIVVNTKTRKIYPGPKTIAIVIFLYNPKHNIYSATLLLGSTSWMILNCVNMWSVPRSERVFDLELELL